MRLARMTARILGRWDTLYVPKMISADVSGDVTCRMLSASTCATSSWASGLTGMMIPLALSTRITHSSHWQVNQQCSRKAGLERSPVSTTVKGEPRGTMPSARRRNAGPPASNRRRGGGATTNPFFGHIVRKSSGQPQPIRGRQTVRPANQRHADTQRRIALRALLCRRRVCTPHVTRAVSFEWWPVSKVRARRRTVLVGFTGLVRGWAPVKRV